MMTTNRRLMLAAAAIGALVACNTPPSEVAQNSREPKTEQPTSGGHDENVVTINQEMLRDLRITTSTVEKRQGGEATALLGQLGVNENAYAEVGTSLSARVVSLRAAEGDRVSEGQPLVLVESGELARARGDLATAESRLQLARQALERKRGLVAERIAPARELQEAENDAAAAESQVRAARATLQSLGAGDRPSADDNASSLILRTPIAGIVLERTAVVGQVIDPATPLFRIADLSTLWLSVQAFERDAVRLRVGAVARIAFAAIPGRTFEGAVTFIGRSVNVESRTVPIRIALPNGSGLLKPGMSATAYLPVGDQTTDLLTVPAAALQRVRDRWCVFVPKSESTFEIRPVGRGRDLGREVELLSGVKAGEAIVVDGAFLLKAETERSASEGGHEGH